MTLFFDRVGKQFATLRGRVIALQEVSLEVAEGEFFVILGPSGCGKSTLLNLAAGLEKPNTGIIRLAGRVVADPAERLFVSPRQRNVAMVFQSYALYPHLSVRENIAFPLRIAGESAAHIQDAVAQTAAALDIGAILERKPAELSGGQRQRVAIARAIVRKPSLFLLDEPLSNLDAQLRSRTRLELKRLQRELGVTTLYVTHDQTEAMTLGDRIGLFNKGRLVQVGTPQELYDRPRTAFAATFIGSPPMNLLPAQLEAGPGAPAAVFSGGKVPLPESAADAVEPGPMLLGIRPEHIRISEGPHGETLAGRILAVENLGREHLLIVAAGGAEFAVLAARGDFSPGGTIHLQLEAERIHLFPAAEDEGRGNRHDRRAGR
jgi:multiple sugar transport system ATP-binding protein